MKSRSHLRGTASIEALMILLVFILVWIGVSYVGQLHHAKIVSKADARTCAWKIAQSGCRSIPPECESTEGGGSLGNGKSQSLEEAGEEATFGSKVAEALRDVLMNQVRGLFAKRAEASKSIEVAKPPIVGDGMVEVGSYFSLPCNTKEFSVDDIANDVWDRVTAD